MFEFDVKEIEKKLEEEYPCSTPTSNNLLAKSILNYHPALHDVIKHWLKGEYLNFEYAGISLKEIVDRTGIGFIDAVTEMEMLLSNDISEIEYFKHHMEEFFTYDVVYIEGEKRREQQRRSYKWL